MNINKKSIITILLALVATTGQAQVKSGLDLCLRDEATGEWLIGLFDDYAIYDCEYWNYAEVDKDHVVLTKDGQRMEVRLRKNATIIDGEKHKTSVLTTKCLPDYPAKDETAWPSGIQAEEGNFTLRVCVRTTKKEAEFNIWIRRMVDGKQIEEYAKIDEQGRFEVKMPVNGTSILGIRNEFEHLLEHSFWGRLAVDDGDMLLLYIDDMNDRAYVMGGKYARFNNELLDGDFHPDFTTPESLPFDSIITQQCRSMAICQTRIDSLNAARPNLSRRFRAYYLDDIQNLFANPMLRNCWLTYNKEEQQAMLNKTETKLNPLQWMRSEVPLMCRDGFKINILYYIFALADLRSTRLTDPDVFLLRINQEGKVQLTDEELQTIKDFHELRTNKNRDVSLNEAFQTKIIPILSKPLIAQYWDWELSEQNVAMQVNVLNSLDIDDDTREILKTQTFVNNIDGKSNVASPRILRLAHQEVHHPRLIQAIDNANQRFMDFLAENEHQEVVASKAGSPASLRVPEEELKDITDGKALFEHITAPFRGYVIYVDVWGTWCGPCRDQMGYVPALKKMLEGKPVVYLYFCNNSPDEAWRIYIRQNHLDTDNAIHYNLPKTQESAIEQYLEVNGFPTYRLVDTTGRLFPGGAPWPSNPSAVVAAIEQLLNK